MLVWNHIILIFWIDGLILGGNVDLIIWELVSAEIIKEICISRTVEVDVGAVRVFRLEMCE